MRANSEPVVGPGDTPSAAARVKARGELQGKDFLFSMLVHATAGRGYQARMPVLPTQSGCRERPATHLRAGGPTAVLPEQRRRQPRQVRRRAGPMICRHAAARPAGSMTAGAAGGAGQAPGPASCSQLSTISLAPSQMLWNKLQGVTLDDTADATSQHAAEEQGIRWT